MSALTTGLAGLKLTAAQKPTQISPVQQHRNKLAKRLWEQAELAKAAVLAGDLDTQIEAAANKMKAGFQK